MWNKLNEEQKIKFIDYCNKKYGKTYTYCETGEPMYFDEQYHLINTKIIIDLLFNNNLN